MKAHKFFRPGARGTLTQHPWPAPPSTADGEATWLQAADGPLSPCRNGLHACRIDQLGFWIADELWEVELGDERIETRHAVIARRARLVRRIDAWQTSAAHELTRACRDRARARAEQTPDLSPRAHELLESTEQFARDGKTALTAYVAALLCAALGPADQQLATFDAERRAQSLLLAAAAGLEP